MLGSRFLFTLSIVLSALSSGCLLDTGAYPSEGTSGAATSTGGGSSGSSTGGKTTGSGTTGGAGTGGTGTGATGGTGGGGTGGTGGTGGDTVTTTTCLTDCMDKLPCSTGACDVITGMCVYTSVMQGTPVSNVNANDCVKEVCDGNGGVESVADDGEDPMKQGDQCSAWVCKDKQPTQVGINQGQKCSFQVTDICQKDAACQGTTCHINTWPDGTYDIPNTCASVTCDKGKNVAVDLHDDKCVDPNTKNCFVPQCVADAQTFTKCIGKQLPFGSTCIRNSGFEGKCNNAGDCCKQDYTSCEPAN